MQSRRHREPCKRSSFCQILSSCGKNIQIHHCTKAAVNKRKKGACQFTGVRCFGISVLYPHAKPRIISVEHGLLDMIPQRGRFKSGDLAPLYIRTKRLRLREHLIARSHAHSPVVVLRSRGSFVFGCLRQWIAVAVYMQPTVLNVKLHARYC